MGYRGPVLLRVSGFGFGVWGLGLGVSGLGLRVEYRVHCKSQWMVVKSQTGPQEAFRWGTTSCLELYSICIYIYMYTYV